MTERLIWGVPSFWIERFPLYFGRHKGFFLDQGLELEIQYFWGGPELAHAVAQGRILIGEMGLPPFLKGFSQGLPARVVGSSVIQQLDHFLVGRPEIEKMADLKGKKIGILSCGSCDDYFIRAMLRASSIDPDRDVELIPLGNAYGRLETFESGKVDAGFLVEPFVALGEDRGCVKVLATVKDYFPRYQWGIILAHTRLLEEEPGLVRRAMSAFRLSCRTIKENPEEAAAFGAQVFKLKMQIFRRAMLRGLETWELDGQLDLEGMGNCLHIQEATGAIPAGLDLSSMVQPI
ncbi:MAG TPA: ABC transporter substrate-binding protein, partial [Anaerolineales bacterium]|nr:ABC transporter substrate-binding protein [Anaerolineales bacterium]